MIQRNTDYQRLFMESVTVLIVLSEDFRIIEWNDEATLILGWEQPQIIGKNFIEHLIAASHQDTFRNTVSKLQENISKVHCQLNLIHQQGHLVDGIVTVKHLINYTPANHTILVSVFSSPISQSVQEKWMDVRLIESELYQSRNMLYLVLDNIPQRVFWKDYNLNYLGCNKAALEDHPLAHTSEIIGKTDYDFFTKEIAEAYRKDDRQVMDTNTPKINYEEEKTKLDDSKYWLRTSKVPLQDIHGNVIGILGTYEDITERKKVEKLLYEQNAALQKLNTELDNFVYRTSHDLRAPLMSVLGLTDLIKLTNEADKKSYYIELIIKSIQKLDAFIKDIIDFSRNSRLAIQKEEIIFEDLLQEVLESFHFMKQAASIRIKFNIQVTKDFFSDTNRLRIVLNNLLSNAIKYSDTYKDSFIQVKVITEGNGVCIEIEDNGQGIGKEHLNKIFDIFYRANERQSGSGLGLYIVKETLQMLKGSIAVWSELGTGTKFTVQIPDAR